jgi:predicted metal-dependent hydrolase
VQSFVEAHRQWIDDAWAQIDQEYVGDRSMRPQRIALEALEREFSVSYTYAPQARRRSLSSADTIYVRSRHTDFSDVPEILRNWLLKEARRRLPSRVFEEAQRVGQSPRRVQVRLQRTRWGSCSAHGTISVNAALLFLPPELGRYLIIHELCHMQHMNHSRAYWRHVGRFEPDYRRLDAELSRSWQQIPWWAMAD